MVVVSPSSFVVARTGGRVPIEVCTLHFQRKRCALETLSFVVGCSPYEELPPAALVLRQLDILLANINVQIVMLPSLLLP